MTGKQKLLLYVYSTPNIVGSVLGLIGLLLLFGGIIRDFWPLIVAGLYGIGYFGTPRNEEVHLSLNKAMNRQAMIESLESLVRSVRKRLSAPVMEKLESLKATIVQILPYLDKFDGSSYNLHSVKSTITDYLPEMLETYLKLPTAYARFHTMKNGSTPRDMLLEQLDVLDREMNKILEHILQNDTDELLVHGRFLKDKFSEGYDWMQ